VAPNNGNTIFIFSKEGLALMAKKQKAAKMTSKKSGKAPVGKASGIKAGGSKIGSMIKQALLGSSKKNAKSLEPKGGRKGAEKLEKNGKKGVPVAAEGKKVLTVEVSAALVAKAVAVAEKIKNANKGGKGRLPQQALSKMTKSGAPMPMKMQTSGIGNGESVCREVACEGLATSGGYCRLHYIKNWKKIQRKALILKEKKLNQYIEELVAKYPDKYIEAIRQDLASDKDFAKVIHDLDLDEAVDEFDGDAEPVEAVIDSIKRDFDDEGEGF